MYGTTSERTGQLAVGGVLGRYRIEEEIGRGGMAIVYRAVDAPTCREVALKVLAAEGERQLALFEREYHTLCSLQHPSVIAVHDFGITPGGQRYYTMELLSGDDLRALAPVPWQTACEYLREVATSLALLHTRKLVHRDVSPRNIRIDERGRAKLLDFGTLAPFGASTDVAGTPMCLAPEAVRGSELDHRADLFSLGVVAYHTLTGKRPFRIRVMEDWQQPHEPPQAPSEYRSEIPPALDQLVLSLLSVDPQGRPGSTADVIERLGAIAHLGDEPLADLAQSHLVSAALSGRERELRQLGNHLEDALRGQGSTVIIEGAAGLGRNRLATEARIRARLMGMTTVQVNAAMGAGDDGVLRALAQALLDAAPDIAQETLLPRAEVLAPLLPGATGAEPRPRSSTIPSRVVEVSPQVQNAMVEWVLAVAGRTPLLVVLANVHATDAAPAVAFVALAYAAPDTRLVLLPTLRQGSDDSIAVQQLTRIGARIRLHPLDASGVEHLVASAFGDVPNQMRLTQWLFSVGHGNPAHSLELLHHLVRKGLIHYAGGTWVLPAELTEADLPDSIEEALQATLWELSPAALQLARILALHKGALSLELLSRVLPDLERGVLFGALDDLLNLHIVTMMGERYRLRQQAIRAMLVEGLSRGEVESLHGALGRALVPDLLAIPNKDETWRAMAAPELIVALEAGLHLVQGGDETLGVELIRQASIELTHRGKALGDAVPALEAAVKVYTERRRSRGELAILMVPLGVAGAYYDFRLTYRYGEAVVSELTHTSGLDIAKQLARIVGPRLGLWLGLGLGAVRYHCTTLRRTARTFREAVLGVFSMSAAVCGTASPLLDTGLARSTLERVAPLAHFPPEHPARITYEFQVALEEGTRGHYVPARVRCQECLSALQAPKAMRTIPAEARAQLEVGVLILLGCIDCFRTDGSIHRVLDALESQSTTVSRQTAAGLRATHHGTRGELALFERYQREVDVLAAHVGSTWRQDVLIARNLWWVHMLCDDVIRLKRSVRQLEYFAAQVPTLTVPRDAARAAYLSVRGMHGRALARYGDLLRRASQQPQAYMMLYLGTYARLLRLTGQPERARDAIEAGMAKLSPSASEFRVLTFMARLELARSLEALGQLTQATGCLRELEAENSSHDNPLMHGFTAFTQAEVALRGHDLMSFRRYLGEARMWFERSNHPALLALPRALGVRARRANLVTSAFSTSLAPDGQADAHDAVRRTLQRCTSPAERLQTALDLVIAHARAEHGYLYLLSRKGLRLVAPAAGLEPPDALRAELEQLCIVQASSTLDEQATLVRNRPEPSRLKTLVEDLDAPPKARKSLGRPYRSLLLTVLDGDATVIVGAVALVMNEGEDDVPAVDSLLIQTVTRCIREAGDVREVYLDALPPADG